MPKKPVADLLRSLIKRARGAHVAPGGLWSARRSSVDDGGFHARTESASRQLLLDGRPEAWTVSPSSTSRSPTRVCGSSSCDKSLLEMARPWSLLQFVSSKMRITLKADLGPDQATLPPSRKDRNAVLRRSCCVLRVTRSQGSTRKLFSLRRLCSGM
eukprot:5014424-Prymnesium_polylepis.3